MSNTKERVEKTFNRYLRYPNTWAILTPNGLRYELGSGSARAGSDVASGLAGTAAWLVTRIIDTNGNFAVYEYERDSIGNPRIRMIRYNGNEATSLLPTMTIEFLWAIHSSGAAPSSFRSGFQRSFGLAKLDRIVVQAPRHGATGNPAQVPANSPETRTYRFGYQVPDTAHDNMFYLTSAKLDGFPEVTFAYSNPPNADDPDNDTGTLVNVTNEKHPGHLGFTDLRIPGESKTRSVLVDVTGDARPDFIDASAGTDDTWAVWINNGTTLSRTFWNAPLDLTSQTMPDRHALRVTVEGNTTQDFFDLDGDGYPDLVWIIPTMSGPFIKYCPGTGSGFGDCRGFGGGAPAVQFLRTVDSNVSADLEVTTRDLADMTGDGLPDIVTVSGNNLLLYRNHGVGIGFATSPITTTMPACPFSVIPACLRATQSILVPNGNRRQLTDIRDVNGDGLPDFLASDLFTNELRVAYGNGRGFQPPVATGLFNSIGVGRQTGSGEYFAVEDLIDVNGDGLLDFVNMDCSDEFYSVQFNNGGVWDAQTRLYRASNGNEHTRACTDQQRSANFDGTAGVIVTARFVDFTGDGNPDFVTTPFEVGATPSVRVGQLHYTAPRYLTRARSLSGHHSFSAVYRNQLAAGPFAVHAPIQVTRSRTPLYTGEPERQHSISTSYEYSGGVFDLDERTFTGFFTVVAAEPSWGKTVTTNYGTAVTRSDREWPATDPRAPTAQDQDRLHEVQRVRPAPAVDRAWA